MMEHCVINKNIFLNVWERERADLIAAKLALIKDNSR